VTTGNSLARLPAGLGADRLPTAPRGNAGGRASSPAPTGGVPAATWGGVGAVLAGELPGVVLPDRDGLGEGDLLGAGDLLGEGEGLGEGDLLGDGDGDLLGDGEGLGEGDLLGEGEGLGEGDLLGDGDGEGELLGEGAGDLVE